MTAAAHEHITPHPTAAASDSTADLHSPRLRARIARSGLNGYAAHAGRIGQIKHFGLRAVQTVAPKSISAWLKSKT